MLQFIVAFAVVAALAGARIWIARAGLRQSLSGGGDPDCPMPACGRCERMHEKASSSLTTRETAK